MPRQLLEVLSRIFIFAPIASIVLYLCITTKIDVPISLSIGVSVLFGIGFYHAIGFMIATKIINQYIGCRIMLQDNEDLSCACGNSANMFITETSSEDIRVIIQCSDPTCCASVQGFSITSAKNSWNALI
jgi:hypothetical protein